MKAIVDNNSGRMYVFPLNDDTTYTIGRGHDAGIVILGNADGYETVSRVHAHLHYNGDCAIIEDAGSKNGTTVNGVDVVRGSLMNLGDICTIRLGRYPIIFEEIDSMEGFEKTVKSWYKQMTRKQGPLGNSD